MFGNKEKDRMEPVSGATPMPAVPQAPAPVSMPVSERTEKNERAERYEKSGHTILAEGSSFNGRSRFREASP